MGEVHEGESGGPSGDGANWTARYGFTDLASIQPHCIIDSLTYGCGSVEFRTRHGGRRSYGLRPLWPDSEREKVYHDFYSKLAQDIDKFGLKVPILLWKINGKLYVRYGASRLWIYKKKGLEAIRSIICDFDCEQDYSLANWIPLKNARDIIDALGSPCYIGTFEVSHERVDIHNVVPY